MSIKHICVMSTLTLCLGTAVAAPTNHGQWRNDSGHTVPSNGVSTSTCSLAPSQNSIHTNTYQGSELIERLQHSLEESEAIITDDLASTPASEQTLYRNNIQAIKEVLPWIQPKTRYTSQASLCGTRQRSWLVINKHLALEEHSATDVVTYVIFRR